MIRINTRSAHNHGNKWWGWYLTWMAPHKLTRCFNALQRPANFEQLSRQNAENGPVRVAGL